MQENWQPGIPPIMTTWDPTTSGGSINGDPNFRDTMSMRNSIHSNRRSFAFALSLLTATSITVADSGPLSPRSEEHTSELQSRRNIVCRLLLEKKKLNILSDAGILHQTPLDPLSALSL